MYTNMCGINGSLGFNFSAVGSGVSRASIYTYIYGGHAVAQLVEALCYKLEGHNFDSRWCIGIFH